MFHLNTYSKKFTNRVYLSRNLRSVNVYKRNLTILTTGGLSSGFRSYNSHCTKIINKIYNTLGFTIPVRNYPGHAPKILRALEKVKPPVNNIPTEVAQTLIVPAQTPITSGQTPNIPANNNNMPKTPSTETPVKDKTFLDKIFGNASMVNPLTVRKAIANENYHIRRNQEALHITVSYYKTLHPNQPWDQRLYIEWLQKTIKDNPHSILSRQGQVAIEILNSRTRYEETLLRKKFPDFELVDLYKQNQGVCDQSTMYNMLISTHLINKFPYVKDADPRVINSTIIPMFDPKNVSSEFGQFIAHSKTVTGNTVSDLTLCNVPFDFKSTPSNNKNYLVLWDYEQFNIHNDVTRYNQSCLGTLNKIPVNSRTKFQKGLHEILYDVNNNQSLDPITRQNIINNYIIKNIKFMELQDRASLIFPTSNEPFTPNNAITNAVENITLSQKRSSIDSCLTRKAILKEVNTWNDDEQKGFHKNTNNALLPKEEVD